MHLTPREQEKLLIYTAGQLAADRMKRGLKLSIVVSCSKAPRKNHVARTNGMVRAGTLCGPNNAPNAGKITDVKTAQSTIYSQRCRLGMFPVVKLELV